MAEDWTDHWNAWAADVRRFNKFHAPAGSPAGGQFAAASGSGKGSKDTPTNQDPVGQGESGKRVSDLQDRLNALGAKPPLEADGIFGPKTLAAVRAFQKAHGLKVDGLVGPLTTAALRGTPKAKAPKAPAPKAAHRGIDLPGTDELIRAAGTVTNPKGTEKLHEYWVHGEGAAKIRWGEGGDFDRCVLHLGKFIKDPQGYCAKAHHEALGIWPATHAAMEHKAGRAAMATDTKAKPYGDVNSRVEYMRLYPLEDIHILRSADGGDGRTVEAFAAVFDDPAEIQDFEGHYVETIDRAAFNKVLADASRARGGLPGSVKVLYNHGMTIQGTPSERFSMPIGVPVDIRAEQRGLLTRTRYNETPLAEEILENIRSGSITSQSFTGRIVRSDPQLRRGDRHRPDPAGNLRTVRRTELGLREYGPVLWPAYSGAEILGVRMSTPGTLDGDPEPDEIDTGTPPDEEAAPGEPLTEPDEHSARYHQHALYALRSKEQRERVGLVW